MWKWFRRLPVKNMKGHNNFEVRWYNAPVFIFSQNQQPEVRHEHKRQQLNGTESGNGFKVKPQKPAVHPFLKYVLLILVFVAIFSGIYDCGSIGISKERANRSICSSNLKQIGLACKAYAVNDKDGLLPSDFTVLVPDYISDFNVWRCPSSASEHKVAANRAEFANILFQDYVYFGAGFKDSDFGSESPLACDRSENHSGKFINILFGDGHVSGWSSKKTIDEMNKKIRLRPPQK